MQSGEGIGDRQLAGFPQRPLQFRIAVLQRLRHLIESFPQTRNLLAPARQPGARGEVARVDAARHVEQLAKIAQYQHLGAVPSAEQQQGRHHYQAADGLDERLVRLGVDHPLINTDHNAQRYAAVRILAHALERVEPRHATGIGCLKHAALRGEYRLDQARIGALVSDARSLGRVLGEDDAVAVEYGDHGAGRLRRRAGKLVEALEVEPREHHAQDFLVGIQHGLAEIDARLDGGTGLADSPRLKTCRCPPPAGNSSGH